ncbi:MAG: DUF3627 domain-containing protein, partial [Cetobacterium sp.]
MASSLKHSSGALALNDICYRQIKGNYYYGIFGEFQLVVDKSTGCFNATKLCNIGGKNFFNWKRLERTKQLIEYFANKRCPSDLKGNFYEIRESNNDVISKQITGQYVQKELILDIASWISPEFYFKCNNIIINYFVNQHQNRTNNEKQREINELEQRMKRLLMENENKDNIIQEKKDRIDELIARMDEEREERQLERKRMEEQNKRQEKMLLNLGIRFDEQEQQNNELLEKVDDQNNKLDNIQHKLNISVEDRAPQPKQSGKRERFILLKRNDLDYPYYNIRAQHTNAQSALRKQKAVYSEIKILLDLPYHPNSKTLYVRIREELKAKGVE